MGVPRVPDRIHTSEQMRVKLRRLRRIELLLWSLLTFEIVVSILILTSVVLDPTANRMAMAFKIYIPFTLSILTVGAVMEYKAKFAQVAAELRKRMNDR